MSRVERGTRSTGNDGEVKGEVGGERGRCRSSGEMVQQLGRDELLNERGQMPGCGNVLPEIAVSSVDQPGLKSLFFSGATNG